jgi:ABC-type Fe3+ transport system substrate-binding protein
MKAFNMASSNGRKVPNQIIIMDGNKRYFQSYNVIISMTDTSKDFCQTYLDEKYWNYSKTTSKYLNKYLGMTSKHVKNAIERGELILTNLN